MFYLCNVYKSIHFWKGNDAENLFLVSNFTKNTYFRRKSQKITFLAQNGRYILTKYLFSNICPNCLKIILCHISKNVFLIFSPHYVQELLIWKAAYFRQFLHISANWRLYNCLGTPKRPHNRQIEYFIYLKIRINYIIARAKATQVWIMQRFTQLLA